MSEQNFNQSMKPFCGNSNATGMFIEANYPGGVYTTILNSDKRPEDLIGQLVEGIMLAKNYRPNVKVTGMADNDIHNQYVDFVVRTALFHRELDNPTTLGSNLAGLKSAFESATNEMLSRKSNVVPNLNTIQVRTSTTGAMVNIANYLDANSTFLDYVNTFIILNFPQVPLDVLSGNCSSAGVNPVAMGAYSDLCAAMWYIPSSGKGGMRHIYNFLISNGANPGIFDAFVSAFDVKIREVIREYQQRLINALNLNDPTINTANIQSIKNLARQALAHRDFLVERLSENVYSVAKPAMNAIANPSFTTLDMNHHARQFFEDVIRNWQSLNSNARQFYRDHIRVYRKTGSSGGVSVGEAGWDNITAKLDDDLEFVKNLPKNELRINLMKERAGAERVLFGATLPYIPTNKIGKLWYTSVSGVVAVDRPEQEAIRNIYHNVYMGLPCVVGGQTLALPSNYSNVASRTADFDVNDAWVVRNIIASRKAEPVRLLNGYTNDNLLVEDMITKITYHRDDNGYYRIGQDGSKIPYQYDNINSDTCAGTMLKGDQVQCARFVRDCILSGDNNSLSNCLSNLSNQSMFKVAHSELVNMDPEIAIRILQTFKFKRNIRNLPNGTSYVESQSFDTWKDTVLSNSMEIAQHVRDAIEGNPKLCDYLKGVVSFVNMNPAILNPGWRGDKPVQDPNEDPYIKALNRRPWVNPRPEDMKYADSRMLLQAFNTPVLAVTAPGRMINPFSNVVVGHGAIFPSARNMAGGSNSHEDALARKINTNGKISETMELMFADVHDDLQKAGYVLTQSDHYKLENSFKELSKTENRLSELHGMLRTLTDLHSLFKASGCVAHEHVGNVSIENLKNRKDTLSYLSQNINDIQNCIGSNITNQNSKCNELTKYYSALIDASAGRANADVVRVSDL